MIVIGVDEAGRGPLAGPVVAAAAVLTPLQFRTLRAEGLNDSKKLSKAGREKLFARFGELGVAWVAQAASHRRIDKTNILRATLWAMHRSVTPLVGRLAPGDLPVRIVVDGTTRIPSLPKELQMTLPKADARVPAVMAASVVAKVLRDRVMERLHRFFPEYGFAKHMGYPTKAHREQLAIHGPSPVHRLTFGGVVPREPKWP